MEYRKKLLAFQLLTKTV